MKDNYEVSGLLATGHTELNPNVPGRIRNALIRGIKDQILLPKMVIVVPDDDLLRFIQNKNDTSSFTWGKIIHWIMMEMTKTVKAYKELIPKKSQRLGEPFIIWIEAPEHKLFRNNHLRIKFNTCLKNMAKLCTNTYVLGLRKVWDQA